MSYPFNWQEIDTVLLDMDGTLLDLAFDRVFWQERVPLALSQRHGLSFANAQQRLRAAYQEMQQTLSWYCLDYWSERLDLDIYALTKEHAPHARLRDDTVPFLTALQRLGKRRILLTNAHPYNLAVKVDRTGLDQHLDLLLSTHTFGFPKEDNRLWEAVRQHTRFDPRRTLFIDDNETILDAAAHFGIRYCLGVCNPDSGTPMKDYQRHPAAADYRQLIANVS